MMRRSTKALVALLASIVSGVARAAEPEPSPWELDVQVYSWVTGNYGTLDVGGRRVHVDVTPSDVLNLVFDDDAFSASGYVSLAYGPWSVFADTVGGYAAVHVNEDVPTQLCTLRVRARDRMQFVIGDVGFGYRLGQWSLPERRRPLTLGVYVGARYMYFSNDLHATGQVSGGVRKQADVYDSVAWADPLIGVRWSVPLVDWASLDFRGDIGGFGASSDLVWGLASSVRIWLPWAPFSSSPYLAAGYRLAAFDRAKGENSVDLQFRGPTMGFGFTY